MSYDEYFGGAPTHYENDERQAALTLVLLGVAAVVAIALLLLAVFSA